MLWGQKMLRQLEEIRILSAESPIKRTKRWLLAWNFGSIWCRKTFQSSSLDRYGTSLIDIYVCVCVCRWFQLCLVLVLVPIRFGMSLCTLWYCIAQNRIQWYLVHREFHFIFSSVIPNSRYRQPRNSANSSNRTIEQLIQRSNAPTLQRSFVVVCCCYCHYCHGYASRCLPAHLLRCSAPPLAQLRGPYAFRSQNKFWYLCCLPIIYVHTYVYTRIYTSMCMHMFVL